MAITEIADFILWALLIVLAVTVIAKRNLLAAAICFSIYSLLAAALFLVMDAPDVAITEAAIGAAISLLFLLQGLRILGQEEKRASKKSYFLAAAFCLLLFGAMAWVMGDMPEYGDENSPANKYLGKYYNQNTLMETGVRNSVTSILASYRGYDTMGETYVILCAGLAIMLVVPRQKKVANE